MDALSEIIPPPAGTAASVSADELIDRVAERTGLDHRARGARPRPCSRPARPLSLETFLALVADREGVGRGQATEHARAVLDILREATGEKEFHDTIAQLPGEYRVLLRHG